MTESVGQSIQLDKYWYAVRVKVKTEKYVGHQLSSKGVENFIPLILNTKRYKSKIKKTEKPLISCYVFVKINDKEKNQVLETTYVHYFLENGGKPQKITDGEIDILKRVVGQKMEAQIVPITMKTGTNVEGIGGKLTGIRGRIVSIKSKNKFLVLLESLSMEMIVEIPMEYLEATTENNLAI